MRALLVEDDRTIARMYRIGLELAGYDVIVAADGEAGLRTALDSRPHLVVLDCQLPKLDGPAVLAALKINPRTARTHVLMLSSDDDPMLAARCRAMGALDYLYKGLTTPLELARRIKQLMDHELTEPPAAELVTR